MYLIFLYFKGNIDNKTNNVKKEDKFEAKN